jgi:hypothetical protein
MFGKSQTIFPSYINRLLPPSFSLTPLACGLQPMQKSYPKEYSDGDVDTIGYELQNMAASAKKILDEYPDRFTKLDFKLFDFSGKKILGVMRIFT